MAGACASCAQSPDVEMDEMNTKNTRRLTVVVALFRLVLVLWALCGVIWFAAFFGSVTCDHNDGKIRNYFFE